MKEPPGTLLGADTSPAGRHALMLLPEGSWDPPPLGPVQAHCPVRHPRRAQHSPHTGPGAPAFPSPRVL